MQIPFSPQGFTLLDSQTLCSVRKICQGYTVNLINDFHTIKLLFTLFCLENLKNKQEEQQTQTQTHKPTIEIWNLTFIFSDSHEKFSFLVLFIEERFFPFGLFTNISRYKSPAKNIGNSIGLFVYLFELYPTFVVENESTYCIINPSVHLYNHLSWRYGGRHDWDDNA